MNAHRKNKLWGIELELTKMMVQLKELYEAEYAAFNEHLPISIQETPEGGVMEERIESLEALLLEVQGSCNLANKIQKETEGDVHEQHFTL